MVPFVSGKMWLFPPLNDFLGSMFFVFDHPPLSLHREKKSVSLLSVGWKCLIIIAERMFWFATEKLVNSARQIPFLKKGYQFYLSRSFKKCVFKIRFTIGAVPFKFSQLSPSLCLEYWLTSQALELPRFESWHLLVRVESLFHLPGPQVPPL